MPSATTIFVFSAAALGLLVVPGPAVLYITSRSAAHGTRAGLVSVLGVHTGTLVHIVAAVLGLSALVVSSALAFSSLKLAGAAYLLWLGVRTITSAGSRASAEQPASRPLRRVYWDGVVVNALNPKTALFFLAFLPQFVDADRGAVWLQTLLLGVLFVALGVLSDSAYAWAGAGLGRWLRRRPARARRSRLVEGGVLVGLGVAALVTPSRSPAGSAS